MVTVLRLTGLDLQFEIFATVLAATSAPARLRVPDAGPRRHPPGPLRRTAAATHATATELRRFLPSGLQRSAVRGRTG